MDTAYDFDSFDSSDIFDPLAPYRSENPEDEDQSVEPATTPYESTEYQDLQQFYHDQDPAYSDKYRSAYWALISFAYEKLKETPIFHDWRHAQFDCQFGKCALCGKPMTRNGFYGAQVDHIVPRYHYGSNYADNLCLIHGKCNRQKGTKHADYIYPSWAKPNQFAEELDETAWEILQDIYPDFPDHVPADLLEEPSIVTRPTSSYPHTLDDEELEFEDLDKLNSDTYTEEEINLEDIPF